MLCDTAPSAAYLPLPVQRPDPITCRHLIDTTRGWCIHCHADWYACDLMRRDA